jgi:hypothetical protein
MAAWGTTNRGAREHFIGSLSNGGSRQAGIMRYGLVQTRKGQRNGRSGEGMVRNCDRGSHTAASIGVLVSERSYSRLCRCFPERGSGREWLNARLRQLCGGAVSHRIESLSICAPRAWRLFNGDNGPNHAPSSGW